MAIQTITLDPNAQNIEDQSVNIRNETGGALAEGDLVYVSGWDEATTQAPHHAQVPYTAWFVHALLSQVRKVVEDRVWS